MAKITKPKRRKRVGSFDLERTKTEKGNFDLLNTTVSFSVAPRSTHLDLLLELARQSGLVLVESSSLDRLKEPIFPRGNAAYGTVFSTVEKIIQNYPDLEWWMSGNHLHFGSRKPKFELLTPFERRVGELYLQYGIRRSGSTQIRLPLGGRLRMAQQLDEEGFNLAHVLPRSANETLKARNQKSGKTRIQTLEAALRVKDAAIVRAVLKTFYRAREKYEKVLNFLQP